MASQQSSLRGVAPPVVLAVVVILVALCGDIGRQWLSYDRAALGSGEVWRLLSGHLVHLGSYHALLNILGLIALTVLCPERLSTTEWLRRVVLLSLLTSTGLYWLAPGISNYVGLSGVIHGLFLLGLVPMVKRGDLIALGCLLYLLGKIAWESYAGAPLSDELAIGGKVVIQSHLFGTLAALCYGLLFRSFSTKSSGESAQ